MNLHDNRRLFTDAVLATAQYLDINPIFVEKDYWITRSLRLMADADPEGRAIFKGGTSLSKAHYIGSRFSEDIDVALNSPLAPPRAISPAATERPRLNPRSG